ncbi:unnamed protein product, partial [Lymnaea stagnalis]
RIRKNIKEATILSEHLLLSFQYVVSCPPKMKTFFVVLSLVAIASARPTDFVSATDSRNIDLPAIGHEIDALVNTISTLLGGKRNIDDFFKTIQELLPIIGGPIGGKRNIDLPAIGHEIDALVNTISTLLGGKRNIDDFFKTIQELLPLISGPLGSGKRNIDLPAIGHEIDALVNTISTLLGGKRNIDDFFKA